MEGAKSCSRCKIVKPANAFHKDRTNLHGLRSQCKECFASARRSDPKARQLSCMVHNAKKRAAQKGMAFDLDRDYLFEIAPTHCPYLGVKLRWEVETGCAVTTRAHSNSPSLDRIDNSKGYVKGNVVIVSHRANSIKRDATEVELIKMGRRIAEIKMQLVLDDE